MNIKANWRICSGEREFVDLGWLVGSLDRRSIECVELEFVYDPSGEPHANLTIFFPDEQSRIQMTAAIVFYEGVVGFNAQRVDDSVIQQDRAAFRYMSLSPVVCELPTGATFQQSIDLSMSANAVFEMAQNQQQSARYWARLLPRRESLELARTLIAAISDAELKFMRINGLAENLKKTFDLLKTDGWFVEEGYGVPAAFESQIGRWLANRLSDDVRRAHPYIPDELLNWTWCSVDAMCLPSPERAEIQGRRGLEFFAQLTCLDLPFLHSSSVGASALTPSMGHIPTLSDRQGGFLFVSYAHRNREFVGEVCERLAEQGIEYWVDGQLELGGLWDEEIEEKIRNCDGFIACVSKAYQDSKICRRELKYADMLNKPILPLSFDGYLWGKGLEFMFSDLQIVGLSDARFSEKLIERVRSGSPNALR
jgi:hypothetical protein